jgi:hypothetical protein
MSDLISDGNTKVAWVSTIANINAPTVAELTAGSTGRSGSPPTG